MLRRRSTPNSDAEENFEEVSSRLENNSVSIKTEVDTDFDTNLLTSNVRKFFQNYPRWHCQHRSRLHWTPNCLSNSRIVVGIWGFVANSCVIHAVTLRRRNVSCATHAVTLGSRQKLDEIVIQGDVKDDLFDIIPEKWPEIDEDFIDDLGDQKR